MFVQKVLTITCSWNVTFLDTYTKMQEFFEYIISQFTRLSCAYITHFETIAKKVLVMINTWAIIFYSSAGIISYHFAIVVQRVLAITRS
jgi:hypothetical protein